MRRPSWLTNKVMYILIETLCCLGTLGAWIILIYSIIPRQSLDSEIEILAIFLLATTWAHGIFESVTRPTITRLCKAFKTKD